METHRKTGSTSLTYQSLAHKHSPMTLKHKDIVSQIFTLIDRVLFIEKKTKVKFENVTLYPSEIHLILFLYREQDTNVTRIAERLGVTKGAISQTLSRLESKGVLHKVKDPNNKNEYWIPCLGSSIRERTTFLYFWGRDFVRVLFLF